MARDSHKIRYGTYWIVWVMLLAITFLMISIGSAPFPILVTVLLLLVAMMLKASLIGAYFMHLRFERLSLVITVATGIFITALILFVLLSFDGLRIFELAIR